MVIARRALGFNEQIPCSYWSVLVVVSPEDGATSNWGLWGKICKLLSGKKIFRHQMFTPRGINFPPRQEIIAFLVKVNYTASNYLLIISIKTPKSSASNSSIILLTINSERSSEELTRQGFSNQMYCI